MTRRPTSPVRFSARLRGAVLLAAAALSLAPALPAAPPLHRETLFRRLGTALFPPSDPGYIPVVGAPSLRFSTRPPPVDTITPPPVVLYAPPAPPPVPPEPPPTVAAATTPGTAPAGAPPPVGTAMPPLRPEDFLPYFQLDDGSSHSATPGSLQFTPARPALPSSRADYRQQ